MINHFLTIQTKTPNPAINTKVIISKSGCITKSLYHPLQLVYNKNMHLRQKRKLGWLILGLTGLASLAFWVYFFSPDKLLTLIVFYLLVGLSSFFLVLFILNHRRRAVLISSGLVLFLFMRQLELRQPVYLLLILATLVSLELYAWKK